MTAFSDFVFIEIQGFLFVCLVGFLFLLLDYLVLVLERKLEDLFMFSSFSEIPLIPAYSMSN